MPRIDDDMTLLWTLLIAAKSTSRLDPKRGPQTRDTDRDRVLWPTTTNKFAFAYVTERHRHSKSDQREMVYTVYSIVGHSKMIRLSHKLISYSSPEQERTVNDVLAVAADLRSGCDDDRFSA
jgi:hypothetical protein